MYKIVRKDKEPTDASNILWADWNEAWRAVEVLVPVKGKIMDWQESIPFTVEKEA